MSNVADPPTQTEASEERRIRLEVLRAHLHGKGYEAEVVDGVLMAYGLAADDGSRPAVRITCERRPFDGDRWWFRPVEEWIDEASHVTDTVVWIVGRLAGAPA